MKWLRKGLPHDPDQLSPCRRNRPPDGAGAFGNQGGAFQHDHTVHTRLRAALAHLHRLPQTDFLSAHPIGSDGFSMRHRDAQRRLRGVRQHRRRRNRGHSLWGLGRRTAGLADDLCAQKAQRLRSQRPHRGRDDRGPACPAGRGSDHGRWIETVFCRCDPRNRGQLRAYCGDLLL